MLQEEIRAIIEKNLPNETSVIIKEILNKANQDAEKVKALNNIIVSNNTKITELQIIVNEYAIKDQRNAELDGRELTLKKREYDLELTILQNQLDAEKEKTEFTKSVALGLVRNTNYRKSVFDSENQSPYQGPNGYIYPTPVSKSLIETQTED